MFPSVRTRTRAVLLRAVDRAIEFATLGEYGLEVPATDGSAPGHGWSAQRPARRPGPAAPPRRLPRRVQAATPAGRRAAAGEPLAPGRTGGFGPATALPDVAGAFGPPARSPDGAGGFGPAAALRVPTPMFRQRGGSVPAPPHVCLTAPAPPR